ncbi:SpoIIE family protein phosphatase [Leptolyngbya sp. FACHB-17]|uniref:SpoIIE family protein phosphatase n=1 Tax=unclassified Leptolyngbya TaxID=2650499 RepID=UPI00168029ED|nr:SpoIIE family protein phosphatase [Leptolyngbya sp. FACHB-17]MBD2079575.1 SpoIIE family protein phosphatase [Leptolyngbya sp. FACHB-17]
MRRELNPKLKLLIVDDEPDNLDLLYRTFRRNFEVIRAKSAIEALKVLDQQGEVAIIISDQRMPEMLGTEFLSRTADRFPDTIRIVLTGYTDVEDLVDAINSGKVFKYITKPWKPQQLQVVVEQAAETYRVLKQRTADLRRALRRESSFNAITTAIRESLDYQNMLQTIVETIGITFEATCCILHPVEGDVFRSHSAIYCTEYVAYDTCQDDRASKLVQEVFRDRAVRLEDEHSPHLVLPLAYQQELLAILSLHRAIAKPMWSSEDIELIQVVAEQAALAISQARLYRRTQQQAEQIRAELAVARQIQTNLLRQTLPSSDKLKVQACCHPAREVGGDFFEVYQHPQGDLWLAVGDVSGKGVPAALFMASAISVLRRELSQEPPPDPDQVMRNLNSILSEDLMGTNCFITMVLARYTPGTHQLVYANAGHIYPVVWSKRTIASNCDPTYLKVRGVPLGILPDWKAAAGQLTLTSGEVLLLTSDGITEATIRSDDPSSSLIASAGAMLCQTGLWKLLQQAGERLDLKQLLAQVQAHNSIQEDDQTILSLEVL